MAYAPHTNTNVQHQLLCGVVPTTIPLVLGCFRNAETGATFEFAERRWADDEFAPDCPHIIYVGNAGETRLAKVLKTVAFVVVDEDEFGAPVIEKWAIKGFIAYPTDWVRA